MACKSRPPYMKMGFMKVRYAKMLATKVTTNFTIFDHRKNTKTHVTLAWMYTGYSALRISSVAAGNSRNVHIRFAPPPFNVIWVWYSPWSARDPKLQTRCWIPFVVPQNIDLVQLNASWFIIEKNFWQLKILLAIIEQAYQQHRSKAIQLRHNKLCLLTSTSTIACLAGEPSPTTISDPSFWHWRIDTFWPTCHFGHGCGMLLSAFPVGPNTTGERIRKLVSAIWMNQRRKHMEKDQMSNELWRSNTQSVSEHQTKNTWDRCGMVRMGQKSAQTTPLSWWSSSICQSQTPAPLTLIDFGHRHQGTPVPKAPHLPPDLGQTFDCRIAYCSPIVVTG